MLRKTRFLSVLVLWIFISRSICLSEEQVINDSAIELGPDRILSVSKYLKETYHNDWRGWEETQSTVGIHRDFGNSVRALHDTNSDTLYIASSIEEEELNTIHDYSANIIESIQEYIRNHNIKEVFFTGFKHGACMSLVMARDLERRLHDNFHINQIKVIIFGCFGGDLFDHEFITNLETNIGKQNILHFKNKTWKDAYYQGLMEIGVPITILLTERTHWGIPGFEDFEKRGIEISFKYARYNYMTSPTTSLNVIGVPLRGIPFAAFLGLGGVSRRGFF